MLELPAPPRSRTLPKRLWLWLLIAGLVVWALATAITAVTRDTILVPTVIMVGSFLVPVTMVAFAVSRRHQHHLTSEALLLGFLGGGTLGVLLSALTETYLLPSAYGTFAAVGAIEEGTKALVVVAVAGLVGTRRPRDGMILGATVGAGFASFESAGYALSAAIGHSYDHPILRIIETELTRAALAPFGHITWTALLGGALFASAQRTGSFRLDRGLIGTFARIVALHGAWDASYGWAILITKGLEGDGWALRWPSTEAWIGEPTGGTLVVFQIVYTGLLVVNSLIGASWVVHRWRRYGRRAKTPAGAEPAEASMAR
jgi:RsiW-degrading membrane proteinase PrsW (M82 family)